MDAERHQELRHHRLRSGCAHRQRFLALGVFNIPASTTSVPLNAGDVKKKLMPKGAIQSRTDFGTDGYGGPCPPQGDKPHHYIFTVYAVDEDKLQFAKDHNVSAAVVGFELHFHAKAKGVLTAIYGR